MTSCQTIPSAPTPWTGIPFTIARARQQGESDPPAVLRSWLWHQNLVSLLPWATDGVPLAGARVLELGSGPGQSTH